MFFKGILILILIISIYFGEISVRKYKNLNTNEKESKQELFASRTNFVLFVLILSIIVLLLLIRFFGEFSKYFFFAVFFFGIIFDYFDSRNKIEILEKYDFSSEFLRDYDKSTKNQTLSLLFLFVLTLLGLF